MEMFQFNSLSANNIGPEGARSIADGGKECQILQWLE